MADLSDEVQRPLVAVTVVAGGSGW